MTYTGIVISDFNTENLDALLSNCPRHPTVKMVRAPYGQVYQTLMDANAECWQNPVDFAVVWTRPQAISPVFKRALNFESVPKEKLIDEVGQFCTQLKALNKRIKTVFVPAWVQSSLERGLGAADLAHTRGIANQLMRMNLHLADQLQDEPGIHVLNGPKWVQCAGAQAFNEKLWYMSKTAFGNKVFKQAAEDIKTALDVAHGGTKKLIILDLDNTLWGGVVGDTGWQGLTLGGHDPVGEAFVDFQYALKALRNRGFILAIASKNEASVALNAIEKHPEMVLEKEDFSAWRINWNDKAQNILQLVGELNLGLHSAVFIDDNPAERARVSEALTEVTVPDWPTDPLKYCQALASLSCFDTLSLSDEDLQRAEMYKAESQRNAEKYALGSLDEWLETLQMVIRVEPLSSANLPRAAQLLNKTNQMNLQTRRLAESELADWSAVSDRQVWTFHVSDRFGPQGLVGLLSVEAAGDRLRIIDFILSCRVMGRNVEDAMLATACQYALNQGYAGIDIQYLMTSKNQPCLRFFTNTDLQRSEENHTFHWESADAFSVPGHIQLETMH